MKGVFSPNDLMKVLSPRGGREPMGREPQASTLGLLRKTGVCVTEEPASAPVGPGCLHLRPDSPFF